MTYLDLLTNLIVLLLLQILEMSKEMEYLQNRNKTLRCIRQLRVPGVYFEQCHNKFDFFFRIVSEVILLVYNHLLSHTDNANIITGKQVAFPRIFRISVSFDNLHLVSKPSDY